jgi:hypothetical protein
MIGVFVEGLDAKRTAKRDHSIHDLDGAHAAALLDGFLAKDAILVPIFDPRFSFIKHVAFDDSVFRCSRRLAPVMRLVSWKPGIGPTIHYEKLLMY